MRHHYLNFAGRSLRGERGGYNVAIDTNTPLRRAVGEATRDGNLVGIVGVTGKGGLQYLGIEKYIDAVRVSGLM